MGVNAYTDVSQHSMDDLFSLWNQRDQQMSQLLGQADARMDAADDKAWSEDMNSYYAKAAQAIGGTGFEGAMQKAGIQTPAFQQLLNTKYFKQMTDLIHKITREHVATGNRRNPADIRELEKMLSNPEMSAMINKLSQLDSYIQKGGAQWDSLPDWKKDISGDPRLRNDYITKDGELNPMYDLDKDGASGNILALANMKSTFGMADFLKELDKSRPAKDQTGVSVQKASQVAMGVLNMLTPDQRNDLYQESLYHQSGYGDYQRILQKYGRDPEAMKLFEESLQDKARLDAILTKEAKGGALSEVEKDLLAAHKVQQGAQNNINQVLNKYVSQWTSKTDPLLTSRYNWGMKLAHEKELMEASTYDNPIKIENDHGQTLKSKFNSSGQINPEAQMSPHFTNIMIGGGHKPTVTNLVMKTTGARKELVKKVSVSPLRGVQATGDLATSKLQSDYGTKSGYSEDIAKVQTMLDRIITANGMYDHGAKHYKYMDKNGKYTGEVSGYVRKDDLKQLTDLLGTTVFHGMDAEKFLNKYMIGGATSKDVSINRVGKDNSQGRNLTKGAMIGIRFKTSINNTMSNQQIEEALQQYPTSTKNRQAALAGNQVGGASDNPVPDNE